MNESFSDELISAYLDGELTPDEQACVEQALVESAEARQVFEELRALRGDLQAQPRHRLPADFSERVIRRAEQAMLREAESFVATNKQPVEAAIDLPSAAAPAPLIDLPSRPMQWSGVVWAFAALAAALLVALYLPNIELRPVALNNNKTVEARGLGRDVNSRSSGQAPSQLKDDLREAGSLSPESLANRAERKSVGPEFSDTLRETSAGSAPAKPAAPKAPVAAPGTRGDSDSKNLLSNAKKLADTPAGPAAIAPAPAAPPGFPSPGEPLAGRAGEKPAEGRGPRSTEMELLRDVRNKDKVGVEPPFFVVRLPATRAALESGAFEAVLRKHQIRLDDAEDNVAPAAETSAKRSRQVTEQVLAEGVDVLYVEATVAQIDGVLADLQVQSDRFLGVSGRRLAEDEAASALQYGASREKMLAPRNRPEGGVEGLEGSFRRLSADKESAKYESSDAKVAKSGENNSPVPLGGGIGGGAASRGIAPITPAAPGGGVPGPAPRPASDARVESKPASATSRGAGARAGEEAQSDGIASRIPSPSFKEYSRFEPRYAENGFSREADAAGKRNESRLNLNKFFDAYEAREAEKAAAFRAQTGDGAKHDRADTKGLLAKGQAEQGKQRVNERLDRLDPTSAGERVRVVFVIRAVEQEPAARPEK